jgi:hypothetical protein
VSEKNILARLEEWKFAHKAHAVQIEHDDGYGADCWVVTLLGRGNQKVVCHGVAFTTGGEIPPWLVYARPEEDFDEWPTLSECLEVALDVWERLYGEEGK